MKSQFEKWIINYRCVEANHKIKATLSYCRQIYDSLWRIWSPTFILDHSKKYFLKRPPCCRNWKKTPNEFRSSIFFYNRIKFLTLFSFHYINYSHFGKCLTIYWEKRIAFLSCIEKQTYWITMHFPIIIFLFVRYLFFLKISVFELLFISCNMHKHATWTNVPRFLVVHMHF